MKSWHEIKGTNKLSSVVYINLFVMGTAIVVAETLPVLLLGVLPSPIDQFTMIALQCLIMVLGIAISSEKTLRYIKSYQRVQLIKSELFANEIANKLKEARTSYLPNSKAVSVRSVNK